MENNNSITTLHQLLDYDLRKFIAAEVQLMNFLKEWIGKSGSLQLKTILYKYLDFVKQHVQKLETFIKEEDINSYVISDRVMKACVEDAGDKMKYCADAEVKDACLLASVQVIIHFKISVYGTAAAFAKAMHMEKTVRIFHEMEANEKHIDSDLTRLAETEINTKARSPIAIAR